MDPTSLESTSSLGAVVEPARAPATSPSKARQSGVISTGLFRGAHTHEASGQAYTYAGSYRCAMDLQRRESMHLSGTIFSAQGESRFDAAGLVDHAQGYSGREREAALDWVKRHCDGASLRAALCALPHRRVAVAPSGWAHQENGHGPDCVKWRVSMITALHNPHPAQRPEPVPWFQGARSTLLDGRASEDAFALLQLVFRPSGGLVEVGTVSRLLADHHLSDDQPAFDDLLECGQVFALPWHGAMWMPMFQFDLVDLQWRPSALQVRRELPAELGAWQLATWFARPNTWLHDARPVDRLPRGLHEVLNAARADRYIAS